MPAKRHHVIAEREDGDFSYLDQVLEEERQERAREIERLKRALWRFDHRYVGSDGAFWDMVCAEVLGLEVR